MEKLYLKQKVFAIREKFTFFDVHQHEVYRARGSLLAMPQRYELIDTNGQAVIEVVRTFFSLMPEFKIVDLVNGTEICKIRKRFRIGRPILDMTTAQGNYLIDGSFWAHDFNVFDRQNRKMINVRKQWISWGDTYEITIDTELVNKHVAAGIVLAIDCTYHSNNK
jgi:uncharacterized protein YxjI